MARSHQITANGSSFLARHGELLLDAALSNGIDLPYDCRAGHCGTCCVRLVSGEVGGGEGSEPGIVHACQCRIVGDVVIETGRPSGVRTIRGVLSSLLPLSPEVMEVGITTDSALLFHAGQYAQVCFRGYPSRPFSLTHPLRGNPGSRSVWFHVRRMADGRVTTSLGKRIKPGHRVKLTGPYGSAHFRPNLGGRMILVATNTGFAPIWSIAVAALRENPERRMMIIAGGRTIEFALYGSGSREAGELPQCVGRAYLQHAAEFDQSGDAGPADRLSAALVADRCSVCLRRAGDGRCDQIDRGAHRRGLLCGSVRTEHRRHGRGKRSLPRSAVARWAHRAADASPRHRSPAQPTGSADACG